MIIADDAATAGRELEAALERVSQRVVAEQLCVLDNSIGFSVSRLVLTKFQLLRAAAPKEAEVVTESEPVFEPERPLALAAHASGTTGEVFDAVRETVSRSELTFRRSERLEATSAQRKPRRDARKTSVGAMTSLPCDRRRKSWCSAAAEERTLGPARESLDSPFEQIAELLDDPSAEVREKAVRDLYEMDPDQAATLVNDALRDGSPEERRRIGSALADSGLLYEAIDDLMAENHESCYGAFSLLFLVAKAGVVEPLSSVIEKHPSLDLSLAVIQAARVEWRTGSRLNLATLSRQTPHSLPNCNPPPPKPSLNSPQSASHKVTQTQMLANTISVLFVLLLSPPLLFNPCVSNFIRNTNPRVISRPRSTPSCSGLNDGAKDQVLLGITGSGKTFTIASVIRTHAAFDARAGAQQDTRRAALSGVSHRSFPRTRSSISSLTTTTTSPKPTFPPPTSTSKKKRSSTKRSIACGCRRRARCSNAAT